MKFIRLLLIPSLFAAFPAALPAETHVTAVASMPPGRDPQILYWFFKPDSVAGKQYRADLDRIARESPFTLVFLTSRGGANFYDTEAMHPVFADLVSHAHALGLKVGLQLFSESRKAAPPEAQGLVEEKVCRLDRNGEASFRAEAENLRGGRNNQVIGREVLAAYAFKPSGDGFYDPASLKVLGKGEFSADTGDPSRISVKIAMGGKYAGYSVYVMTVHTLPFGDVFSQFFEESFGRALESYADIPFDGTALDEFGTIRINRFLTRYLHPWTGRWYSPAFAKLFAEKTGVSLERALFDMRFAPKGDDGVRVRAINHYFDLWRLGVLKVERAFYEKSKALFGPGCFAGVHDTFHNRLTNDEYWATGINWWAIPREYGQTDEDTPFPTRFGIALGHPEKVPYNMFYDRSVGTILDEAAKDAAVNSRVHYHAFNDSPTQWGADLRDPAILGKVAVVERKVRLLDQFDGPEPEMPVLIVFGFPALANWYPDSGARNGYDMNGDLGIEEKAKKVWDAGYRCALIPSDKVDEGSVTIEGPGRIVYGGHVFSSVIYLYPQYAKEGNLAFLEQLESRGCPTLIEGVATRDFEGRDVSARFERIRSSATCVGFDVGKVAALGAARIDSRGVCRLTDGSVIVVDAKRFVGGEPGRFDVSIGSKRYTGLFTGLLAIKAGPEGAIEKLAASGLKTLERDGTVLLSLFAPADLVLRRRGADTEILVQVAPDKTASIFERLALP